MVSATQAPRRGELPRRTWGTGRSVNFRIAGGALDAVSLTVQVMPVSPAGVHNVGTAERGTPTWTPAIRSQISQTGVASCSVAPEMTAFPPFQIHQRPIEDDQRRNQPDYPGLLLAVPGLVHDGSAQK